MKTKIYRDVSLRFLVEVKLNHLRVLFKTVPWRVKLGIIDLLVGILNSLYPYCTMCMDTYHCWVKCKPFVGYPHSGGWKWIGRKYCYMKGFKK